MDPNVAYDRMIQAEKDGDWNAVAEYADDLRVWMAGGGFEPDRPNARAHIANAIQRADAHRAGRTVAETNGMNMHD